MTVGNGSRKLPVDRFVVDGGTTTTRAWAVRGREVLSESRAMVGARDTARDGSAARLHAAVKGLLEEASMAAQARQPGWAPVEVVAAGMITSPLGLADVPHVAAPADLAALAGSARRLLLPEVSPLPMLLVPGVRCGPAEPGIDDLSSIDVMRGEEAVCLGLAETDVLGGSGVGLSVGSHWKLVEVEDSHIVGCSTTLGGELLHVLRTQTVLSASVDAELPAELDESDLQSVHRGIQACTHHGLPRAAFMARLLERIPASTSRDRLVFLLGVVVGDTARHWVDQLEGRRVALLGAIPICQAWQFALQAIGATSTIVAPDDIIHAYVGALVSAAELAAQAPTRS